MAENAAPGVQQDWEASKENFQPLKAGRKATALRDSTAELRTKAVEERRRWAVQPPLGSLCLSLTVSSLLRKPLRVHRPLQGLLAGAGHLQWQ
jgi:hypothetical protein